LILVNIGRSGGVFGVVVGLVDGFPLVLTDRELGRRFGEGLYMRSLSSSSEISSTPASDTRLRFWGDSSSEISSTSLLCPEDDGCDPLTPLTGDLDEENDGRGIGGLDMPGGSFRA